MFNKICLILAILASGGALAVSHFVLQPKIDEIKDGKKKAEDAATEAGAAKEKAQAETKTAKADLAKKSDDLKSTQSQLSSARGEAKQAKEEASAKAEEAQKLGGEVEKLKQDYKEVSDNHPVQEIKRVFKELPDVKEKLTNTKSELDLVAADNRKLRNIIAEINPPKEGVKLPPDLSGKVKSVDPKWAFVILDVKLDQGAMYGGVMLVHRDGKYVARVRLVDVQSTYSVANILKDSQKDDILEGDVVVVPK